MSDGCGKLKSCPGPLRRYNCGPDTELPGVRTEPDSLESGRRCSREFLKDLIYMGNYLPLKHHLFFLANPFAWPALFHRSPKDRFSKIAGSAFPATIVGSTRGQS